MSTSQITIEVEINGDTVSETIPTGMLLSDFIRNKLDLTGTHRGCESGKCGACTVLFNGEPIKSCNMLAAQVDDQELVTIEGISDGNELHPVQEAFWMNHGLQCGYCTPGFVMNSVALLEKNQDPTEKQIRKQLAGNICRCTGYTKIFQSVQAAAETNNNE